MHAPPQVTTSLAPPSQANWLRQQGVRKGDAVAVYLPMTCELPIAMLACARIGALHTVVFAGFSAEALAQRIQDSKYAPEPPHRKLTKLFPLLSPRNVRAHT